jgi:hypothetical protein
VSRTGFVRLRATGHSAVPDNAVVTVRIADAKSVLQTLENARGAIDRLVKALEDVEVALSYLDATPLDEPGIRQAHLESAQAAIDRGLGRA